MPLLPARRPAPRLPTGAAAIEFALILTLMVSMLAGIVEFGRTFWYYDALSKATRNAARGLAVSSKTTIATVGMPAAIARVVTDAKAAGLSDFTSSNVLVTCLATTALTSSTCTDGTAPTAVKVEIVDYKIYAGKLVPFLIGGTTTSYTLKLAPSTTMPYMPLT